MLEYNANRALGRSETASDVNRLKNLNRLKMSFNRLIIAINRLIAIKNFNRLID